MVKGIHLLSGGLDSIVAAHLLKSNGVDLTLLHFVLPFYSGIGLNFESIKKYAEQLNLPLLIVEEGEEFLAMVRDPEFGYGKNANPCVDCRIHRLVKAKKIMEDTGASFISTGEVMGQRPMSQRRDMLFRVESDSGCKGMLLRPLSAALLPPTNVEKKGLVDRSRLLGIAGRSRKIQLEYAKRYNLKHQAPAGGCILTNTASAHRFIEMTASETNYSLVDFKLIAYGRHFRLAPKVRLIISRDESENTILLNLVGVEDCYLYMVETTGPIGVLRGEFTEEHMNVAASMVARYSKARTKSSTKVAVAVGEKKLYIDVKPAEDSFCNAIRL